MSTAKVLQKATIISIQGGTIKVQHPDLSQYSSTYVTSPLTAGGTTLTVADNDNFSNSDIILIGEVRDEKTESVAINGAVTRGSSITIANTTKFSHEIHAPVVKLYETQVKIYGSNTGSGVGTLVATASIQWDQDSTEYTLITTDTAYSYYAAAYYDGTTVGTYSDYVASSGLSTSTVASMVQSALDETRSTIDNTLITREFLLRASNDWQDEVSNYTTADGISKDWNHEMFTDETSILLTQNENVYSLSSLSSTLKYTNSYQGILNVRYGSNVLLPVDISYFDEAFQNNIRNSLSTGVSAGDTSCVLSSTAEFSDSGSAYIGSDVITYSANNKTTNTLSGIPASGSGSFTASHSSGASVWQNIAPQQPSYYTVFNNQIMLDSPVDTQWVNYPLKVRALKKLTRFTSFSSSTVIPFTYTAKYHIAASIFRRKGDLQSATLMMTTFREKMEMEAAKDGLPTLQSQPYYNFDYSNIKAQNGRDSIWPNITI